MNTKEIAKAKILICSALAVPGTVFLVCESANFLTFQSLPTWTGWMLAVSLESYCLWLAMQKGIFRVVMMLLIVAFVLYASSFARLAKLDKTELIPENTKRQIAMLQGQISGLEKDIAGLMSGKQMKNAISAKNKKIALIDKLNAIVDGIETNRTIERRHYAMQYGIMLLRAIVEILNLMLAHKIGEGLRVYFCLEHPETRTLVETSEKLPVKDSMQVRVYEYIKKTGIVNRAKLLSSKCLGRHAAKNDYDKCIDGLIKMGAVEFSGNGKKAGHEYRAK
jgi:hypothetical protein